MRMRPAEFGGTNGSCHRDAPERKRVQDRRLVTAGKMLRGERHEFPTVAPE